MDNKNNNTNEIKIELPAEVASGHYSNLAVIAHGAGEFYLDFIAVAPNMQQAKVQTRVIMTPENAKNLLFALRDNIAKYESVFGDIERIVPKNNTPENPDLPPKPMSTDLSGIRPNDLCIYNSMSRGKEAFKPLHAPLVGMYVCGPTVYGDAHLGHARPAITFDIVLRYLRHLGYKVRYVRNITDVGHLEHDADDGEDKIAKKARLEQLEPMEVVQYYLNRYHHDMEALNVLPPSIEPHASGHIIEQIEYIKKFWRPDTLTSATATSISMCPNSTATTDTDASAAAISTSCWPPHAPSTGRSPSIIPPTSPSGKKPRRSTSCTGRHHGAKASPDGTSSAAP